MKLSVKSAVSGLFLASVATAMSSSERSMRDQIADKLADKLADIEEFVHVAENMIHHAEPLVMPDSQMPTFKMPSEIGETGAESYMSMSLQQVGMLMHKVAHELGFSVQDIPEQAIRSWHEVLRVSPGSFADLKAELSKQLFAEKKQHEQATSKVKTASFPHEKRPVDWLSVATSPKFPNHALKVKSPESLGIDSVKQYSGYLDDNDGDKHYFYWFFESRNDPENDPVVLWLNGGPGCSSLTGLFFELGPASIGEDLKPVSNEYAWNSNASVIFLDQPVNTGYSYSDSSSVSDTVTAGKDAYAFLSLFFEQFPEYNSGQDFHISGESYAGHYIPVFASEILSHEDRGFNLSSVLIGNGLVDPLRQYDHYQPMACGGGGEPSVLSEPECQAMLDSQPRCNSLINACYSSQSAWTCVPATVYCNNAMMGPYQQTGRNVYDIRSDCEGSSLCYPQLDFVDKYLNQDFVKEAVGAEIETYSGCNFDINRNFVFSGDWMKPYYTSVINLLEQDVPVLVYAGDKDFICNWLGNDAWSQQLEWSGSDKFSVAPLEPWTVDGEEVGQVRNAGSHFTFLRVYDAGHMVPFNQPAPSLAMLNEWVKGNFGFN